MAEPRPTPMQMPPQLPPTPVMGSIASTPAKVNAQVAQNSREHAMAYYEKLRKQLRELIQQKRHHDKQLALYEDNIFKAETAYLEETSQNGNIIKGFDNYVKGGVARRKATFSDQDRIFSLSSLTYAAKLQQEASTPATAASTPTVVENPRQSAAPRTGKASKNKRKKAEDESESVSEVETPGPKRVRISFSGQGGTKD